MSTNCIDCIKNKRTGTDRLCDDCRLQNCPDCKTGRPQTALVKNFPGVFIGCSNKCGHAIVYGRDYKEAAVFWNMLK